MFCFRSQLENSNSFLARGEWGGGGGGGGGGGEGLPYIDKHSL